MTTEISESSGSVSLTADPRFLEGKVCLKDKRYDAAIEFFSNLLESGAEKFGDQSLELAPIWYWYGSALLSKEEENPSDDLLGVAAREAKKAAQILGGDGAQDEDGKEEEEDEEDDAEAADGGDNEEAKANNNNGDNNGEQGGEEADDTDMTIAWESLEVCRKICSAHSSTETDELLADTHNRLGDLLRFNGDYEGAIAEYAKCLELQESFHNTDNRALASAHYMIAVAHIYNSSEAEKDVKAEKKNALEHYTRARDLLQAAMNTTTSTTTSAGDVASSESATEDRVDLKDSLDELNETVDALKKEIKALEPATSSTSAFGAQSSGFGFPQSSTPSPFFQSSAHIPPAAITSAAPAGTSSNSSSTLIASTESSNANAPLHVKKKVKLSTSDETAEKH